MQSQFDHFPELNAAQKADAEAMLSEIRERVTDQARVELIDAGIVKAADDKERSAQILSSIFAVAKTAKGIIGFGL